MRPMGEARNEHICPHTKECQPNLSVPDVLIYCPCGEMQTWHHCHYCCPKHGIGYPHDPARVNLEGAASEAIVELLEEQDLASLEDLMAELGITEEDLDAIEDEK